SLQTDEQHLLPPQTSSSSSSYPVHRPRLLIHGDPEHGQAYVGSALLHRLESFPIFSLDFSTLAADAIPKSLEEACVNIWTEAKRKLPAVLYPPPLEAWWQMASPSRRLTLLTILEDTLPSLPLLLVCTCDSPIEQLPDELASLFPDG